MYLNIFKNKNIIIYNKMNKHVEQITRNTQKIYDF